MNLSPEQAIQLDAKMLKALRHCHHWHEEEPCAASLWLLQTAQQRYRTQINPYIESSSDD